jgi:hypothetical protein
MVQSEVSRTAYQFQSRCCIQNMRGTWRDEEVRKGVLVRVQSMASSSA